MSIRTAITGTGWTQIGTGPAIVQVLSPEANGVEVMVAAQTLAPATNSDGLILNSSLSELPINEATPIWAQVVQPALTANMVCQPVVA
jgi:hypothetical protein